MACSVNMACMNSNWDEPELSPEQAGIGNNAIKETHVVSIADLKAKYNEITYRNNMLKLNQKTSLT